MLGITRAVCHAAGVDKLIQQVLEELFVLSVDTMA